MSCKNVSPVTGSGLLSWTRIFRERVGRTCALGSVVHIGCVPQLPVICPPAHESDVKALKACWFGAHPVTEDPEILGRGCEIVAGKLRQKWQGTNFTKPRTSNIS